MAKLKTISETKNKKKDKIASKPPHAAPSGTRWVRGKDGWMLHEINDPDRGIRGLHIRRASNKSNKKSKTG